jgi:hypothetical protein
MTDAELENMTVEDLRALRDKVDDAIRAQIAKSRSASAPHASGAPAPTVIDLERERDAWQARRR